MLEPPYDDAWGDADTRRKVDYRRPREDVRLVGEATPLVRWDEHIRREGVRLPLLVAVRFGADKDDFPLARTQDVSRLMEETEPKLIVRFVVQTKLEQRLRWAEPASRAVHSRAWNLLCHDDGDACLGAQPLHLRQKDLGRRAG